MTDAQTHIDNNFANTETNITVESLEVTPNGKTKIADKLNGKLVIKNYPNLETVKLEDHELEGLVIINCPKLEQISVRKNKLTEFDITKVKTTNDSEAGGSSPSKISKIVIGENPNLEKFSAEYCSELTSILAPGCPKINEIPGLDKLEKVGTIMVEGGLFGSIFPEKLKYFREVVEVVRSSLGFSPDKPLPSITYTDPVDGKIRKKLDKNGLGTELKNKIVDASPLKTEKENVEKERDAANAKLQVQSDYDAIKTERDQLKQNFEAIVKKLGLADQSTQDQVLTKIEQLMNKPDSDNSDKISDLERQLSEKNQRISELENNQKKLINKQNIVEGLKNGSVLLSASKQAEIANASSGHEVWKICDQAINKRFEELVRARKNAFYLNIGLGSVAVLSLLGCGFLIIWKTNSGEKNPIANSPKKKPKLKV